MEYDYVIVGAGSAGCVLAARLSEDPQVRVCLIESGGPDTSALIHAPAGFAAMAPLKLNLWAYETVPQPGLNGRRGYQPRGKTLGGSSSVNAMIYLRGRASDYDRWAAAPEAGGHGCTGWSWQEVLPYFLRAEHNERFDGPLHARGGPLNVADLRSPNPFARVFVEAAVQAGYTEVADFNTGSQEGVGTYQVTQKDGQRMSAARAYLHPARSRPNLAVLTGAHALRVRFAGTRAVGVEVARGGAVETVAATREVLLAAGAFQSPQLLMCSGVGPRAHLLEHGIAPVADAPEVGANLHDHIDYIINRRFASRDLFGLSLGGGVRLLREIRRYRRERRGMVTTNFAESGGFVRTLPELAEPDVQFHFVVAMVDNHNRTTHFGHGYSLHACVLNPRSRGTLRLASADARAAPLIDPGFLADPADLATLVRAFRAMRRILGAPAFAPFRGPELYTEGLRDDDEAGIEAAIRERADTIYHPVGTCRMGGDAQAVVDPELRVRGVAGLRVVDASVMPALVSGNTNAPTIMIAEKGADLIRRARA
ncbi:MAG: GMC family oxidoreductase N-terminal domain-containing protein [Burkholderiales bacterium]|nr:GMC family oxidoreductase N-terminal domain-containing protein [Burkholderiales bacterium]